ncbi:conserved hypothetical protein [Histoplasma capsulatum H143]|uniref:Uncharacterized protein n=1 Tax=Ajellomyces capsulatus (strain H143) TaxID=544712 RepID=C6H7B3_AJECH|nr:conserved hypothetical protein [Histoplasma capsulatum H143]
MTNQNANDPTKEIRNVLSQMVQRKYEAPTDGYQTSAPPISNANLEYLRGNTSDKDCAKVFEEYQKCLSKTLKERGLDGMVKEARNGSKESDEEFLKKACDKSKSWTIAINLIQTPGSERTSKIDAMPIALETWDIENIDNDIGGKEVILQES